MANTLTLQSLSVPAPSTIRGNSVKLSSRGNEISYAANRSAIIRTLSLDSPPSPVDSLSFPTLSLATVAKISPSGQYLAVGEQNGTVKVWDLSNKEDRKVKFEFKNGGRVVDLAWDGESSRIAFVGEGKEKFGSFYSLSTGTQVGEISGHAKVINSVAMRQQRPFRAITGSDDCSNVLLNGVPFKYASTMRKHTRFVQSVDYSPDGTLSLSAGSDGLLFLSSGTDGADHSLPQLLDPSLSPPAAHKGTIFAATFSRDSKSIITSSADKSTKLWNVDSGKLMMTWDFSPREGGLENQQVGNCWIGGTGEKEGIVSLNFAGDLTILDPSSQEVVRVIYGHKSAITALSYSTGTKTLLSGDAAGATKSWTAGVCTPVVGEGHSNLIIDLVASEKSTLSIGMDDVLRQVDGSTGFSGTTFATKSLPKGLATTSTSSYLLTSTALSSIDPSTLTATHSVPLTISPTAIAASEKSQIIAVGAEDGKVHLFSFDGLKNVGVIEKNRSAVSCLRFANDGITLAVGESSGKILLIDITTKEVTQSRFVFHTARINSLAFNTTGERLLSGSLDGNVMIYSLKVPSRVVSAKSAHVGGVNSVLWESEESVVSGGGDGCIKVWKVPA